MSGDKLVLHNMIFYGYHGVFVAEKELGQRLEVDVELQLDLRLAGVNDDLEATVNYVEVYTVVKEIVEERAFNLVEAVAEEIATTLLGAYSLQEVCVRIRKPQPPVGGTMDWFAVEIRRQAGKKG
jgi:dihydroneopterin aldolase